MSEINVADVEAIISLLGEDPNLRFKFVSALIPRTEEPSLCSFCGEKKVYAKGLCRNCYVRYRNHGTPEYLRTVSFGNLLLNGKAIAPIYKKPWQEKFVGDLSIEHMPPDFNESVEEYVNTLSSRTQACVIGHFRDKKSYRQLANDFGISGERVRQIINNARRKMDKRIATLGNAEIERIKQQLIEEEKNKLISNLRYEAIAAGDMTLKDYVEATESLSVRAYNAFARSFSGFFSWKVKDFINYISTEKQGQYYSFFKSMRNAGTKTAKELARMFVCEVDNERKD